MKNIVKAAAGLATMSAALLLALILYVQYIIPDTLVLDYGEKFVVSERLTLASVQGKELTPKIADSSGNVFGLHIHPRGQPVREAMAGAQQRMVVPGGNPFGIKLHTQGVLVVGMTDIQRGTKLLNPAKDAGIKVGDVLTHIDGQKLLRGCDVRILVASSEGDPLTVTLLRGGQTREYTLMAVLSEFDNAYKAGIWVRDSSAGIGTMTYFDPEQGTFAGLGHAVCDVDTGAVMPLGSGQIVDVNISGVNAGQSGRPGELRGTFHPSAQIGELLINSEAGLFGILSDSFISHDPIPMARRAEIVPGPAVIFSTISGNKPQSFDISIEKVNNSDITPTKNMVIRIKDDRLLAATGGIVQGMSGSPIIQDGRLVGAITHVFVNDPTRGYGIFAENMDKQLRSIGHYEMAA